MTMASWSVVPSTQLGSMAAWSLSTQVNMLGKDTQLHKRSFIYFMQYTRQLTQETAVLASFPPTSQKGSI